MVMILQITIDSYPGSGPNIIKEFRPGVIDGINTIEADHVFYQGN